jgi:hypothetical protein
LGEVIGNLGTQMCSAIKAPEASQWQRVGDAELDTLAGEIPSAVLNREFKITDGVLKIPFMQPILRKYAKPLNIEDNSTANEYQDAQAQKKLVNMVTVTENLNEKLAAFAEHLKKMENDFGNYYRQFLATYSVNTRPLSLQGTLPPLAFGIPGYSFSALKSLFNVRESPRRDFEAKKPQLIEKLKQNNVSQAFIQFWENMTPQVAQSLLNKYFNIETQRSARHSIANLMLHLEKLYETMDWLNGETSAAGNIDLMSLSAISSTEVEVRIMRNFAGICPAIAHILSDSRIHRDAAFDLDGQKILLHSVYEDDGPFDLDGIMKAKGDTFQHAKNYFLGEGLPNDLAHERAAQILFPSSAIQTQTFASQNADFSGSGPKCKKRKRRAYTVREPDDDEDDYSEDDEDEDEEEEEEENIRDMIVKKTTAGRTALARNSLSLGRMQAVIKKMDDLDRLVQPFARIVSERGRFRLAPNDFRFLSYDYDFSSDLSYDSLENFFSQIRDFGSLWPLVGKLFDDKMLKVFNSTLDIMAPTFVKSLFFVKNCITLTQQIESNTLDSSTRSLRDLISQNFFPTTLSFREGSFLAHYLSKLHNDPSLSMGSVAAECIYDTFLLQPHIQLLLLHSIGYLIRWMEEEISTNSRNYPELDPFIRDAYLIFNKTPVLSETTSSGNDPVISNEAENLLVVFALVKILDFIFFMVKPLSQSKVINQTNNHDKRTMQGLKDFGRLEIKNVEEFDQVNRDLVSAAVVFQNNICVQLPASIETNLLLNSKNQMRAIAALVLDKNPPIGFFSATNTPTHKVNSNMAYFLYKGNAKKVIKKDDDDDAEEYDDTILTGSGPLLPCDGKKMSPQELRQLRGTFESLAEFMLHLCQQNMPRFSTIECFKILIENPRNLPRPSEDSPLVLPLSYSAGCFIADACCIENFFKIGEQERQFGSSAVANKYLVFFNRNKEDHVKNFIDKFEEVLEPVSWQEAARAADDNLFYLCFNSHARDLTFQKIGQRDLCVVNAYVDFDWVKNVKKSIDGDNWQCSRQKNRRGDGCQFIIVPKCCQSTEEDRDPLFSFNPITDTMAVPRYDFPTEISRLFTAKCPGPAQKRVRWREISTGKGDMMTRGGARQYNNKRKRNLPKPVNLNSIVKEKLLQLRKENENLKKTYSRQIADKLSNLGSRDDAMCATSEQVLTSTPLASFLIEYKKRFHENNNRLSTFTFFDFDEASRQYASLLNPLTGLDSLLNSVSTVKSYDAADEDEDASQISEEERARRLEGQKILRNVFKSLTKNQSLLQETVVKLNTVMSQIFYILRQVEKYYALALILKISLVHFYENPQMYIFDAADIGKYGYLKKFLVEEAGYFVIHLPKFVRYAVEHTDKLVVKPEWLIEFIYFLSKNAVDLNPYLFIFTPSHVFRNPTFNAYIAITSIFLAHAFEKDAKLV